MTTEVGNVKEEIELRISGRRGMDSCGRDVRNNKRWRSSRKSWRRVCGGYKKNRSIPSLSN